MSPERFEEIFARFRDTLHPEGISEQQECELKLFFIGGMSTTFQYFTGTIGEMEEEAAIEHVTAMGEMLDAKTEETVAKAKALI